jgi:hypothetical protein
MFIGKKPTDAPLTSSDVADGIITSAKIADGTIVNDDVNASAAIVASKLSGAGITEADIWRITANLTLATSATDITANWEIADTDGYSKIGTGMTESSGIFTFPSTGIYLITIKMSGDGAAGSHHVGNEIKVTTDNSTYTTAADGFSSISGGSYHFSIINQHIFDVTNTSTHKVKFTQYKETGSTMTANGSTSQNITYAMFIRLGNT